MSFSEAAAVGLAYVTAYQGLIEKLKLSVGESVLITGTSGSVGMAAVQIAKWMGVKTFGLDKTVPESMAPALRPDIQLLADDDMVHTIYESTEGRGVHCVFDSVGAPVFELCMNALGDRGRYLLAGNAGPEPTASFDIASLYQREIIICGINTLHTNVIDGAKILEHLRPGFESGHLLAPAIARTVRLREARSAYAIQGWGKTVILMDEDGAAV